MINQTKTRIQNQFANLPYWVAGLLTGMLATAYAVIFKKLAGISFELFLAHFWTWAALVPVGFFVSWYSVKVYSPEASGSGIPQVMAAIQRGDEKSVNWYRAY